MELDGEAMTKLLEVNPEEWKLQLPQMREHYARFGDRLPTEMRAQLEELERRLGC
jgi:phosphoenolpyruvate carboxykinase (GTP)